MEKCMLNFEMSDLINLERNQFRGKAQEKKQAITTWM